jgi:ribokinase
MTRATHRVVVAGSYNASMTVVAPSLPRPGETVKGHTVNLGPGGKGANQAIGARRLGADVIFLVALGNDEFGDAAAAILERERLPTEFIIRVSDAPTGVALIAVDDAGRNQISIAPGANERLRDAQLPLDLGGTVDVLVCQLECPVDVFATCADRVRSAGGTTILNPAPAQRLGADVLARCDFLIPNEVELEMLTGIPVDNDDGQVLTASLRLISMGTRNVVATLGSRGALWTDGRQARRYTSPHVPVVDTTGAGDAFCAGFAAALSAGNDVDTAIRQGVRAGAFCVTRLGVIDGLGTPEDLERLPRASPEWDLPVPICG